jgi:hypothetical protein
MFDELEKYKESNHFFLKPNISLGQVCNAPTNKSGVYLVYTMKKGKISLVYIGRSGKVNKDGSMFVRKAALGGIKDRIVNGHQFGKIPRRISWHIQMIKENIEALDIYWYITHNAEYIDCPRILENKLLTRYIEIHGCLPEWNNEV